MKRWDWLGSVVLVLMFGTALIPGSLGAAGNDGWVAEEVLRQLEAIHKEIRLLRQELAKTGKVAAAPEAAVGVRRLPKPVFLTDYPLQGSPAARVAILEFSDYECPFCRRHFTETLPRLRKRYVDTGQVAYLVSDFPLDFHPAAASAAIAARCAAEQDAFWRMHDALFGAGRRLETEYYEVVASRSGLDLDRFRKCMDEQHRHRPWLAERVEEAKVQGVSGTPAFLIGRVERGVMREAVMVSGAQPFVRFERILDRLLRE